MQPSLVPLLLAVVWGAIAAVLALLVPNSLPYISTIGLGFVVAALIAGLVRGADEPGGFDWAKWALSSITILVLAALFSGLGASWAFIIGLAVAYVIVQPANKTELAVPAILLIAVFAERASPAPLYLIFPVIYLLGVLFIEGLAAVRAGPKAAAA